MPPLGAPRPNVVKTFDTKKTGMVELPNDVKRSKVCLLVSTQLHEHDGRTDRNHRTT